jgi:hypothetical protein
MMPSLLGETTTTMSFDDWLERLAGHQAIVGLLLIGSGAAETMTEWSDIDLLVVFDRLPAPFRVVNTWVDDRLTEVYCITRQALDRITTAEAWPSASEEGVVVAWLRLGRIVLDRDGELAAARDVARSTIRLMEATDEQVYHAWVKIGYNVAQMKRYLAMGDDIANLTVDMRLLYSLSEVMTSYFVVRRLPWQGEKAAIRYWMEHDPVFLEMFQACLAELDRQRKVGLYEEVARLAVEPVGALWTYGTTAISLGWGFASDDSVAGMAHLQEALTAWVLLAERAGTDESHRS